MTAVSCSRRIREASNRVYDPGTINALLSNLTPDQRGLLWKLYRASRNRLTAGETALKADLISNYKAVADDIQQDIGRVFSNLGTDKWDLTQARRIGQDRVLWYQIDDRIRALGGSTQRSFDDALLDQYKTAYVDAGYRLDVLTPASATIKFGILPDREILALLDEPWKGARFSDRLGVISDEMAGEIKKQLVRSMMSEESWQDAARRIRSEMGIEGQRSVWRAEMIARTELAHAQEMANAQFGSENADVIEDEYWVAHPGACEECADKHGLSVSEVGRPPLASHPNCACDVLAVPKSWGGLAQVGDGDFSIRPASRQSWAQAYGLNLED